MPIMTSQLSYACKTLILLNKRYMLNDLGSKI